MFKHVPNILTILRFLLIPFIIIAAIKNNYIVAMMILTISGITDVLDGFIARKWNFISDFGKLMDPLADKATQLATLSVLVFQEVVAFWILAIVLFKEFILVSGASFLYGKELVVSSKWYGKVSTVLFYCAIVTTMIFRQFVLPYTFDKYLYYFALTFAIFSLIMYLKAFYTQGYIEKSILVTQTAKTEEKKKKKK